MLRKRTRSIEKDHQMAYLNGSEFGADSHFCSDNHKTKSLFSAPGLFVGLSPRGLSDSDSVWSPTSPLDFRAFSNLCSPFRTPKSPHNGQQKSWDTSKVGLSIIDSLDNGTTELFGEVLRSESKNICFGPQMRIRTPSSQTHINSFKAPQSLPKNFAIFPNLKCKSPVQEACFNVIFEIGDTPSEPQRIGTFRSCSLDSCSCRSFPALAGFADRSPNSSSGLEKSASQASSPPVLIGGTLNSNNSSHVKLDLMSVSNGSGCGLVEALSGSEIELSEDYTCVISHGPNPKTIHIYGDCILEGHSNEVKEKKGVKSPATPYPSADFLSFCYTCNKKLEGKDIYIYRGEKAFCSFDCRSQEILIDEEMKKTIRNF